MSHSIAVVGSVNQDLVIRADRVPRAGETLFGDSFVASSGGKGANQAVALARLGIDTKLVGCVGADSFGRDLCTALADAGVRTGLVKTVPGPSGIALVQVEARGENRITVIPGANTAVTPEYLAEAWHGLAQSAMILAQLETPMPTTAELARRCRSSGIPLMLDPAPAASLSADVLRAVTWITPNLTEAQVLLGTAETPTTLTESEGMARRLLELGPSAVLLKLGGMGAVVARRGEPTICQPAFPVAVLDTTAAGDATNAAFATALVRGQGVAAALAFACAAAALCVSRHGAQQAMPFLAEVEAVLRKD